MWSQWRVRFKKEAFSHLRKQGRSNESGYIRHFGTWTAGGRGDIGGAGVDGVISGNGRSR